MQNRRRSVDDAINDQPIEEDKGGQPYDKYLTLTYETDSQKELQILDSVDELKKEINAEFEAKENERRRPETQNHANLISSEIVLEEEEKKEDPMLSS